MAEKKKTKKVLVIEDDAFLVRAYQIKFGKVGLETIVATNADEVDSVLRGSAPSVILLDLMLPGISGFDILESIKKKGGTWSAAPVVIVSNLSQVEDIERGKQLGAKEYIIKANAKVAEIAEKVIAYAE